MLYSRSLLGPYLCGWDSRSTRIYGGVFAWIYRRNDEVCINLKCAPEWIEFWRNAFTAVRPGYHLNKKYWNTVVLDGTVPDKDIKRMIGESYDLTK